MLPANTATRARQLRRDRTEPEARLWRALRDAFPQAKFRFQVPMGPYYADFCSHGVKLVIELDGDTHVGREDRDAARTAFINGEGYGVIRFGNPDVTTNLEGVIATIAANLPSPLVGEGGAKRRMRGRSK
ncbi:endonuclease domain-containing protein [Sphingomonas bacterium]|uniref:endonuclease domain-containing protein n=1 Tax=Sphingomonas bacterium TaxID=1895847 RepID=UPI0020C6531C|nr:DUF559 domain-containing protein [Sphingomonas bacterium]